MRMYAYAHAYLNYEHKEYLYSAWASRCRSNTMGNARASNRGTAIVGSTLFLCIYMYNLLKNKRGIIFGAIDERSIAWSVALKCAEEGATFVLTNTLSALQLGTISKLATERDWQIIPCDATNVDDIRNLYTQATTLLGGKIDFVLHAVAQSVNLRRHKEYDSLNYEYFHKTLDISALSLHKILQTAMQSDALAKGASVVTLSYIASERFVVGYGDMGDAKAMLESIVRQMGATYGRLNDVRVNAISQSFIATSASAQWDSGGHYRKYTDALSPLGVADVNDCANVCVVLFSDLTKKITMQTIHNDGGMSQTLLTPELMNLLVNIEKL